MGRFIEDYLQNCNSISLIVLLLDIRHNPTDDDLMMLDYIKRTNLPFILVANKADKIAVSKVDFEIQKLKEQLGISFTPLLPFSAERKIYTDNVWNTVEDFLK